MRQMAPNVPKMEVFQTKPGRRRSQNPRILRIRPARPLGGFRVIQGLTLILEEQSLHATQQLASSQGGWDPPV